jgi:hypothetical protein
MENMKRIRIVGLCLVAVFALSAVAAASASAAETPEYKVCGKTPKVGKTYPTGEYSNKECTAPESGGKYRLEAVKSGTKFTSKSKAATFTVDGTVVKCKKDTDSGAFYVGGAASEEITFSDCAVNGNKKETCETTGAGAGTIKTNQLSDFLVYLNAEETQLGVLLVSSAKSWAEFNCGAKSFAVDGALLGTIENTSKGDTIDFKVSSGHQAQTTVFEGGNEETGVKLYTEPGEVEATLETTDEQSSKGIGAYPF